MSLWAQQAIWDLQKQVKELEARLEKLEHPPAIFTTTGMAERVANLKADMEEAARIISKPIDKRTKAYREIIGR